MDDLTVRQAADQLGITPRAVNKLINEGKFPGARQVWAGLVRAWVIPADEVSAYASAPKNKGGRPPKQID